MFIPLCRLYSAIPREHSLIDNGQLLSYTEQFSCNLILKLLHIQIQYEGASEPGDQAFTVDLQTCENQHQS
jgi:hypothetical protein